MPIRIPDALPAAEVLRRENIFVMHESRAIHQDIRPMEVVLLNLMPKKIDTENQILRLLANTPLQVNVKLLRIDARESHNTPNSHLERFYRDFDDIKDQNFDGLIVTGAPLGLVPFEEVHYWDEIRTVIDWSRTHVTSTLFLCWAAQAALNHLYGLPKKTLGQKLSGVYEHRTLCQDNPLVRGFDDYFLAPLSRYADFDRDAIASQTDLQILADHPQAGVYLAASEDLRQIFVTGHPEYDADTLAQEYQRDSKAGINPALPCNYFPGDDPAQEPRARWRSHANLLYSNWLNYCVYQITPYDLAAMEPKTTQAKLAG
ncbi:homoserine O-acetyltransferase MetA [Gallaecimonas xiamenensis]|uniref:Homoserine O-succinyltransferase n=1 Tax=Gallaecimonas xiamenensis 3-C-1 TaxID=745411 RepID=K2ILG1_9GAMM|nr:homoserine O-succinyltransferase [Gallaecimonas xiamenensis]EKE70981.1 homoserine O-succinyltransferase [Gallaecimonas xiamenensis 3-C-1]